MKQSVTRPTLSILGTEYTVYKETAAENPKMEGNSGLCEPYAKRIILDTEPDGEMTVENFDAYCHRVLRHEAFHAILFETGMSKYYEDEDLVELLAQIYPKIKTIMDKCESINIEKIC